MGKPHRAAVETHIEAMLLQAGLAEAALAAGQAGVDRDAHAGFQRLNAAAGFLDNAGRFMAENQRLLQADRAEPAMLVIMQVRAADAAGLDANFHLAGAGAGSGGADRFDAQVMRRMDDGGAHWLRP